MAGLHPLELLAAGGALVTALLTLLQPESRARLVAAWSLVGVALAAVAVAGPREEMYGVYAAAAVLAVAAWSVSRRVASAPVREVWREGRGRAVEHVTQPEAPWRWIGRLIVLIVAVAGVAFAVGLLRLPWDVPAA